MKDNQHIWVLLETGETHELFATLDEEAMNHITDLYMEYVDTFMDDDDAPDIPRDREEAASRILEEIESSEDHSCSFGVYELRRQKLNETETGSLRIEAPEFEVEKGAEIWEAAIRIIMGCDLSYALNPVGYFTRSLKGPDCPELEWRKHRLS